MKLSPVFVGLSLALAAQASWFAGSDRHHTDTAVLPYSTWSATELRDWLDTHAVVVPKGKKTELELRDLVADNWNSATAWTHDQYAAAQKSFQDLRDSSFDAWDESKLREWLLTQGVVNPKGPREKLVVMAKERYSQYQQAASSLSASASTAVYGDSVHQASKSLSSVVAMATEPVVKVFDESKDYIYSTWDENQMRRWLEEKGLLKTKEQKKKDELVGMMHDAYGRVASPVWNAWSDSYLRGWLLAHNIIKSDAQKNREYYTKLMDSYYYSATDSVWHSWSDSQLRNWLIEQGVIKSDAQITRDKMLNLVSDNYLAAKNTFWDAWTDNQLKAWLVEHGYMRSDAQVKRDELIKAAEEKYTDVNAKTAAYLTWPDARLRAYLREHGMTEDLVPGGRPGLLQEVRIRWVQTENRAESILAKVRELVNGSAHKVEDVLANVVNLLSNGYIDVRSRSADQYDAAKEGYEDIKDRTEKELRDAQRAAEGRYHDTKGRGEEEYYDAKATAGGAAQRARENVGEKIKTAGSKVKGEL